MASSAFGATLFLAVSLALWKVSAAFASGMSAALRQAGFQWSRFGRAVTNSVAGAWVGIAVYGGLKVALSSAAIEPVQALTIVIPLIAACAALERWRWARITLLGAALVILADAIVAGLQAAIADRAPWYFLFTKASHWTAVLRGSSANPWFGSAVVALALITVGWLRLGSVRHEFEYKKRQKTRSYQRGIAGVLVGMYCIGLNVSGLSRQGERQRQLQARSDYRSAAKRIALNPGRTTSGQVGRR
jgi:hypothetical protein